MPNFNLADYVDVQTRITRFWEEYPDGAIRTALASDPGDFTTCRYRAEVYKHRDNPHPDATGYAFEIAGSGMANKTSHEENCETSALGRALANMGYATSGKDRPSRQEMSKASNVPAQTPQRPPDAPKPPQPTPTKGSTISSAEGVVVAQMRHVDATPAPDREKVIKALHATGTDAGLDHDALHRLIVAKGFEGIATAPIEALVELGKAIKADPGKLKTWLARQAELLPDDATLAASSTDPDRFTR